MIPRSILHYHDTEKYISNLFRVLNLNWYCPPHNYTELKIFISKHYDRICNELFDMAIDYAVQNELDPACLDIEIAEYCKKAFHDFALEWQHTIFSDAINSLGNYKRLVFYGGGEMCRFILKHINIKHNGDIYKPNEIWDVDAAFIKSIDGIPVVYPNFDGLLTSNDYGVIIAIKDLSISEDIERKFLSIGFSNYVNINKSLY